MDVVTLPDLMVGAARFSCRFFTAMAENTSQGCKGSINLCEKALNSGIEFISQGMLKAGVNMNLSEI